VAADAGQGRILLTVVFQNLLGNASHRRETVTSERQLGN